MWNDLFSMGVTLPDKALRTISVYLVLAALLRVAGKRDLAQLNSFDLVVMLLLSNVVQNAIIGPDDSLIGGLIGAVILIGFNALVVRAARRSDMVAQFLEGTPTTLARHGRWDAAALEREGLRKADVDAALRRQNANSVADVEELTIEPGGAIVATLRPELMSATKADIARLDSKLDDLHGKLDALLRARPH